MMPTMFNVDKGSVRIVRKLRRKFGAVLWIRPHDALRQSRAII
jgi:hypothetical protein